MKLKGNTYVFITFLIAFIPSVYGGNNADVITIPFQLVKGLIILEAEVDHVYGKYIFDTGAEMIMLNSDHVKGKKAPIESLNGEVNTYETEIENFRIGNIQKKNVAAFITNLSAIESYVEMDIEGILGCNIFVPKSIYINYLTETIEVSESLIKEKQIVDLHQSPFRFESGLPIVEVSIGAAKYNFILDSGASSHFIDFHLLDIASDLFTASGIKVDIVTASTEIKTVEKVYLDHFLLGEAITRHQLFCPKDFSAFSKNMDIKVSGIISLSQMAKNQVAIDLDKNLIYF